MTTQTNTQVVVTEIVHTLLQGVIWGAPLLLLAYPKLGELTVSAIISFIVLFAKAKLQTN